MSHIALCRKSLVKGSSHYHGVVPKVLKNHSFKSNSKPEEANGLTPEDLKRVSR
jgi:hypothetical protein